MIDTHAHLYLPDFDVDLPDVVQRARSAGVEELWIPGINFDSLQAMEKLEVVLPCFFRFFAGLHPCDVKEHFREELVRIKQHADTKNFSGVGEIGLDLYWDKTFLEEQKEAFMEQLDWALERNQPALIHIRNAFEETMPIIRKYYSNGLKGIFHSFAGNLEQAEELTHEGHFLLGINGSITYKKNTVADFLKHIPLEHIVTETDCPFLGPVPHRGKRNEPENLKHVVKKLSEIYCLPEAEIERQTTRNAQRLFS